MDVLFRALMEEKKYDNGMKKQIFTKMFKNISHSPLASPDCFSLFKLLLEWVLISDNPMLNSFGHEQFKNLSNSNVSLFYEFVTPNLIIDIFSNPVHTNKLELAKFVGEILDLVHTLEPEQHEEQRRSTVNVTGAHLFSFLRDNGAKLAVAAEISRTYQRFSSLLPMQSDWTKFAVEIVHLLSNYRKNDSQLKTDDFFSSQTEEVSRMLPMIWGRSEATEGIQECLKTFYTIISTEDSYNKPSCALLKIIDKIPKPFLESATTTILEESGQTHGEAKAVIGIINMIEWLTMESCEQSTANWILSMMLGLKERERNSILIEIAHSTTEKLMNAVVFPELRETTEPLFFFLLMGFQHSESVFHSLVTHLPNLMQNLNEELNNNNNNDQSEKKKMKRLLLRLGEASHFMMLRFPDFPELYDPLEKVLLEDLKIQKPNEKRIEELKTLSWLSPHFLNNLFSNSVWTAGQNSSLTNPVKKRVSLSGLLDVSLTFRSETGMVGLINLGNTCYMNSVLQALFITKEFCDSILIAPLSQSQVVLFRLQQVFTFLKFSHRSIYSPAEFLKAARPPWFETGRQQDCSEFLRYLLDTLHEQEKTGRGKDAVTYGEHKVIKSNKLETSTTTTKSSKDNNSNSKILLSVESSQLELLSEPPKLKRNSNSALDVISEAPENGKIDEEEDKMSQGSIVRTDEDFGSRGSLFTNRGLELDEEEEEDDDVEMCDFHGSRTSLGSNLSMKRWTTEGNLSSYDGSREGKMDLLDGPLNDSHSNSTDSGIQSVGDSIRGSSDSMTNAQNAQAVSNGETNYNNASKNTSIKLNDKLIMETENLTSLTTTSSPFVSLVQNIFGGKMQTSYECNNCHSISIHKEVFTELHLAIPDLARQSKETPTTLTMQNLLDNYLKPEALIDENKYHCEKCSGLQEAEKNVRVLEGPEHLLCTLMRFKYERTQNRKSKIFTDINYELELELPSFPDVEGDEKSNLVNKYSLYAIVLHSGYSSDGGHYYTYARQLSNHNEDTGETKMELDQDQDVLEDPWFIFNDSKVSFSTFESFKNVSKSFPRDTAYQLFYRKQTDSITTSGGEKRKKKLHLRSDLKILVEKDNLNLMREKEKSKSKKQSAHLISSPSSNFKKDDEEEDFGGGSGGGFNTPGRLVF